MELVAPAAEQPVPVLRRHAGVAEVVILDRRDPDHLGHAAERTIEKRPARDQFRPRHLEHLETRRCRQIQCCPALLRGGGNPGFVKTTFRRLDRVVRHPHLGRTGVLDQPDQGPQHVRVGCCAKFRRPVEGDVRLDQHLVARADVMVDPANRPDRHPQHLLVMIAAGDTEHAGAARPVHPVVREPIGWLDRFAAVARVILERQRPVFRRQPEIPGPAGQHRRGAESFEELAPARPFGVVTPARFLRVASARLGLELSRVGVGFVFGFAHVIVSRGPLRGSSPLRPPGPSIATAWRAELRRSRVRGKFILSSLPPVSRLIAASRTPLPRRSRRRARRSRRRRPDARPRTS